MLMQVKEFLATVSYECMYVKVYSDTGNLYIDKNMQKKYILDDHHEGIFEVIYEFDYKEKLAIKNQNQILYANKHEVIPMLFSDYDIRTNKWTLFFYHKQWIKYNNEENKYCEVNISNLWELLAKHLKILNELQNQKYVLSMKKLLGDNIKKREDIIKLSNGKDSILKRYLKLRQSKLGRIQVKLWESRS
ncbi:hypothetical protein DOS78_07625 [Staphylococcus felis]|nr:hypothetical protein DOS65_09880 [Staphylococcus felis]REI08657.1 hypothetical protein DOS66_08560 [Staphylococcus felis]REI22711.1 hypothetical protein DOS78_07625 [Staphylococcus felis]